METDDFLYNWWLVLIGVFVLIAIIICIFKVILQFPGILDWKFIVQNFEDRVQQPVKKFSASLYGQVSLAGEEMVRKISVRSRPGGSDRRRVRKVGVCQVKFDPGDVEEGELEEVRSDLSIL